MLYAKPNTTALNATELPAIQDSGLMILDLPEPIHDDKFFFELVHYHRVD
jgi:hypothetical protein